MKFIVDGMLGKLGRWLRLLGYDALYFNTSRKILLVRTAQREGRLILTKDTRLCKDHGDVCFLVTGRDTTEQLREVCRKLRLAPDESLMLTRCCLCNLPLQQRGKEEIRQRVPEYVFEHHEHFKECPGCQHVYWDGDHSKRIRETLVNL